MQKIYLLILCLFVCNCTALHRPVIPKTGKKIAVATTAYTAKEKDHIKYGNKTASNTRLKPGVAAARWDWLPVGTKIKIAGNIFVIEDYGSALMIKRNGLPVIDIYKPTRTQMNKWGVKYFEDVEILELGSYEKSLTILEDRLKYPHCRTMYQNIKQKL